MKILNAFPCLLISSFLLSIDITATAQTARAKELSVDTLPAPFATRSVKYYSDVIGWKDRKTPVAPPGFTITKYAAEGLDNPRWMYVLPNGDVLVAETNSSTNIAKKIGGAIIGASKADNLNKSADRITLFRDVNHDGAPLKFAFREGLHQPFGMLLLGKWLYIANTDALVRFPYKEGQTRLTGQPEKIMDLPGGKRHYARNIIANENGTKIYIAIGSGSNVGEDGMAQEKLRADILEINPDGTGMKIYASGLRNPCGMGWAPGTHTLWTAVNERDEMGDELVPDYLTGVVEGGFYGWPYSYYGQHTDPRIEAKDQRPELVAKAIVPDVNLGSHTASLGLAFYTKSAFPEKYRNGAFVAQHGSWNRSVLTGYKVVFVPFSNGKPSGMPEDFLTGFIADLDKRKVFGRPVGIAVLPDGDMLVTDDTSNTIWRVSAKK